MRNFSIRDIESLTGIKAGTIRIWEQRYNLITPKRTSTNIRYYDDTDLRLLLNISVLTSNGYKISEIAQLSTPIIAEKVRCLLEDSATACLQKNALCDAMIHMDESAFDKILHTSILKMGFENTMENLILPFLKKIGNMWQTGAINPAHEHFVSHLIRQKLMVAIDGISITPNCEIKKFLLFLPAGENHDISLLYAKYLIKSRGHFVLYLGNNIPLTDLETVSLHFKPDYALTLLTSGLVTDPTATTHTISQKLNCPLLISGAQVIDKVESTEDIIVLKGISCLLKQLALFSTASVEAVA